MSQKAYRLILVAIGVLAILSGQVSLAFPTLARETGGGSELARTSESSVLNFYLPGIVKNFPFTTQFGVDIGGITTENGLDRMRLAGATWIRRSAVYWSQVEPSEGARNWNVLSSLERELIAANSRGIKVILIVLSTPEWAQKVSGYSCGPVRQEKLGAFASFMRDLVSRYSVPPYNVKYWELWNEPDVAPSAVEPASEFGCWGADDEYYGGGYYADMLQSIYPQVKAADPQAQVVVGGLLLDCDPRLAGACTPTDQPPKFLEGILRHGGDNDGGDFFDGVSFHAYDFYLGEFGRYGSPKWGSDNGEGPVVIAKAEYLKSLLDNPEFGAAGKFLMNTETALVCGSVTDAPGTPPCESAPSSDFELTKAYYIPQVYAAGQALGLRASIWYNVFGWRNSGLLNADLSARPAYTAYAVALGKLLDSAYLGEIDRYPQVLGYEFTRGNRRTWVVWSQDGNPHTLTLDSAPQAITDAMGNDLGATLTPQVDAEPIYIEWVN